MIHVERRPVNHEDARGLIMDIFGKDAPECVTLITTKAGAIRGNHYHRFTTQWMFVVSGKLWAYEQVMSDHLDVVWGEVSRVLLEPGDRIFHPANVAHAYQATEDCVAIAFAAGIRKGMDYEKDTTRVDSIIERWQREHRTPPP